MNGRKRTVMVTMAAALGVAGAGLLAAAPANAATEGCSSRSYSQPFKQWSDSNYYFLVTGGSFESGATGWTTTGSVSVVSGNETWKVLGSTHAKSLQIGKSSKATTNTFCVNTAEDSIRWFYKAPGVSGSRLHIAIRVTSGVNVATNDLTVDGAGAGWKVSQRMMLPDIRDASGQQYVTISFYPEGTQAVWGLDDVMVDPWQTK